MLYVINKENRHEFGDVISQMWKDRHQLFVNHLGWDLDTDGINEIDEFDKDETIYIVSLDDDGNLEGSFRLLPSKQPHLMSEHFNSLCAEGVPINDHTWEVSRFYTVTCPKRNLLQNKCAGELLTGMMEFGLIHDISHYTFVVSMAIFPLVLQAGWDITPLGLPTIYCDELIIAFKVNVTPTGYMNLKMNKNINGPLIANIAVDEPLIMNS